MNKENYHFIAIGGIGMSGLAKYLLELGYSVSGSDVCESKYIDKLKKMGAKVFIGHDENNMPDNCTVVASTAIKETNPELIKAKKLGLKILHRSDLLAELAHRGQFFLGFSGTHGKTTTSGLASYVLEKAGLKPSYVVGGILPDISTNAQFNNGDCFVAELDESDGTIVKYSPDITVINNLEEDHIDFYKDGLKSLLNTFDGFISSLKDNAKVIINNDCENILKLNGNFITFGLTDANYLAKNINYDNMETTFDIYHNDEFLINIKTCLAGEHNVYNALAVISALNEANINLELVKPHFASFTGMGRRFQHMGNVNGAMIYDDYAHHPTEIKSTLKAMTSFNEKHITAVFQPHRYTRLQSLWNDFLTAFDTVDKVVVTDIYAASEEPIEGVSAEKFANELKVRGVNCEYIGGKIPDVAKKILPTLKENEIVVGLGAGTITTLCNDLQELNKAIR